MNRTAKRALLLLTAGAIAVLLYVVIAQGVQIRELKKLTEMKIEGTYATSNFPGAESEYIVLKGDNVCSSYMQLEPVEDGTYKLEGRTITMEFPDVTLCAVHADGQLYVFSQEDTSVLTFQKLSDTPVYVNVKQDALP